MDTSNLSLSFRRKAQTVRLSGHAVGSLESLALAADRAGAFGGIEIDGDALVNVRAAS